MSNGDATLTIPDEFVLLMHAEDGTHHPGLSATSATAAARVGELVLRSRVRLSGRELRVLDDTPTGLPWCDALLETFVKKSGPDKPVDLASWLEFELGTFSEHRTVLVDKGLLHVETRRWLKIFPSTRHRPDTQTRDAVLARISAIADDRRAPDDRDALLVSVVATSGLHKRLGFDGAARERLEAVAKGEELGTAVRAGIAEAADALATTMVVVVALPGTED